MKKVLLLSVFMVWMFNVGGFSQFATSYPNPSVAYIEKMGYTYELQKDARGNQSGVVVLPNGLKADAWAFLQGKTASQYSYCAKKGYATETEVVDHGTFQEVRAVCVRTVNNQKETVPMLELMEKNGEPLIPQIEKPVVSEQAEVNEDPNLDATLTLPSSFDWRSYNGHSYVGPIRNQGACGACYAFGALSSAETVYNFATGKYDENCTDFSESFIIWCMGKTAPYSYHFGGCAGADYTRYELKALVDSGVTYESNFPYQTTDPGTCTHWNDPRIQFSAWYRVACSNIDAIKTAIMTYGAVQASIMTTPAFNGYTGGVYSDTYTACTGVPCYYTAINHCISLVGWGVDTVAGEYWILRNSWGASWGESGYMKIAMTSAAVACEVSYVTLVPPTAPVVNTMVANFITTTGATINGNVNAKGVTTTIHFDYGLTTAYGNTIVSTPPALTGSTATNVLAVLTNLTPGTLYHYRIVATNSVGTSYGSDMTFTTVALPLPIVTTGTANALTTTSASLNGTVNANGTTATPTFQYGLTTSYGYTITGTPSTVTGSTVTAITAALSDLNPGTTYHYRIVGTNSNGTTNGADMTFTTVALPLPTVTTTAATNIILLGATLNGTVNANGTTTTAGFEYGLTTAYGSTATATPSTVTGSTPTAITVDLTCFVPNTTYHFRAVATNATGTVYGADFTFTTPQPPTATTVAATSITSNGATINGTVNANGSSTNVTFEYGLTITYGNSINATPYTVSGTTATAVSAAITGLLASTTYHYRVKAESAWGVTYGSDLSFTTNAAGCVDTYETNNTQTAAKQIATGTTIFALIGVSGDLDYFKFSNSTAQKNIKIELTNLPADYDVQLLKSNGSVVATSANRGTTSEIIKYNTNTVATYYIKVYGYNGAYNASTCYNLKVTLSSTTVKSLDETETVAEESAPEITVFPNPTTGTINLDYTTSKEENIDVRILNITGKVILSENVQASEGQNILHYDISAQTDGVYILQVVANNETVTRKVILRK